MATKLPIRQNKIKVGRGTLLFQPDGEPGAWNFNECPGFTINIEGELLTVKGSRSGISETVLEKLIGVTRTSVITCIDNAKEIIKAFLAATQSTIAQASGTVTGEIVGPIQAARAYRLGTPAIVGGARKISAVTVAASGVDFATTTAYTLGQIVLNPTPDAHVYVVTAAGTSAGSLPAFPTVIGNTVTSGTVTIKNIALTSAWVNDTDYSYDPEFGVFNIHETGRIADAIALAAVSSGTLSLKLGYTRAAASTLELKTGAGSSVTGQLWFFEEDPITEERKEWVMPSVTLTPNGDFSLITTEVRQIEFNASINKPATREAIYCNDMPVAA